MKRHLRGNSGFTLIELIVVIAVLAILATITIVAVSNYLSDANETAAKSNGVMILNAADILITVASNDSLPDYTTETMITALEAQNYPVVSSSPADGEIQITITDGEISSIISVKGNKTATWTSETNEWEIN